MPSDWGRFFKKPKGNSGGGGGFSDWLERSGMGGDSDAPAPIGVPEGYEAPFVRSGRYSAVGGEAAANWGGENRTPGTIGGRPPAYHDGDEFKPATLDPASVGQLQAAMAAAGILSDFRYGVWDEPSRNAYKQLLGEANAAGLSAEQMIQQYSQGVSMGGSGGGPGGEGGGGGGGGRWEFDENGEPIWVEEQYVPPPLEIKTTNPEDLKRAFRTAIIDTMGEGWNQAQIDEMVNAYNWMEVKVQKDAYDQQVGLERAEFMGERTEGGETISSVSIESPDTFLENELREKDPVGFQTGEAVNEVIPNFFDMMGGWV